MIVPLHNHSEYSALDGLSSCKEIAKRVADLGCPCCGLTDHGIVSGHLEFDKVLRGEGIKPIFGCELYQGTKTKFDKNERDQFHLVAGALTDEGLRNLWRLSDKASTFFRYVGRVNWDMLQEFNEGLFITSACIQGLVPKQAMNGEYDALNSYLEIFGDRFFIELHTYPGEEQEATNKRLVEIARERGVGLVYANDAHFASPEQYPIHDAYLLFKGETVDTPTEDRKMWHPKSLYIQSEEEIRQNLSYLSDSAVDEAIANTVLIGEMCNAKIPDPVDHRPVFLTDKCPWLNKPKTDPNEVFVELVEQGIVKRYGEDNQEAWDRAAFELEVLLDADLADYFLMAWDLMQYCKSKDITTGPGRGSSAGCIVAYALEITDVDPLKYGLYFERFYNPGRAGGLPDIDSDFPREARKPIIQYLSGRWGDDRVRVIGNISRMTPKAALDRFWSKFGITFDEKEEIKRIIVAGVPDLEILDYKQIGWSEEIDPDKPQYIMEKVGEEIETWIEGRPVDRQEKIRDWLDLVAVVCNRIENYGIHASGVVISDVDLAGELPKRWVSAKEVFVTQFPMIDVEKRNFMKLDILGLRTLDTLEDWKNQMKEKYDLDIEWSGLEDKEALDGIWELLDKGLARGIFQIEKGFAAQFAKDMKIRSIEDLAIAGSIIRPGPNMFMDTFLKRRNGEEPVEYDDPFLEDILENTLGIFLYQEQVIEYFKKVGYTLTEADEVRRILGKKQPVDLQKLKEGKGQWKGRGYFEVADPVLGHKQAVKIWNNLERFAAYSFNKSHAIAYSINGWRTGFSKYLGTAEFILALIRTNEKNKGDYVAEARRMGINVSPPDILRSNVNTIIDDDEILYGLSNVKGVGKGAARLIIEMRERGISVKSPEEIDSALDTLDDEWKQLRDQAAATKSPFRVLSPRTKLKRNQVDALYYAGAFDNYLDTEFTLQQKQKYEQEYLDIILSDNSQEIFSHNQEALSECDSYSDLDHMSDTFNKVLIPGIITHIRETQTRKTPHKKMGIVKIEYEGDEVEFVVFPQHWKAYRFLWAERTPGIFLLKKTDRGINFEEGSKLS